MYAIIAAGGKQFKVGAGDIIEVEKLDKNVGEKVEFDVLMTVDGEKVATGGEITAKASAEVVAHGKGRKIVVFKYKAKKNVRKKQGHRQPFSKVKIVSIG